jgi:HAD superfamily hydrolase (TIGR01509 family)
VTGRLPAAVLWDMDGTLVDTEPYWIDTEHELAAAHGSTWSQEHALNLVGQDLLTSGAYIREHMALDLTPEQIVDVLLDGVVARVREAVPWRAGARELVADLAEVGVPCALVTMSYRRFVDPILAALEGDPFTVVVTGDQVTHGKPHPEPYLAAAERLGLSPGDCLAIEDSATGAASAVAAGCLTLCVPNHVDIPGGPGRIFRDSLLGLSARDLAVIASS